MRHYVAYACMCAALAVGMHQAHAQETPKACTKDYLVQLEDDLQGNKDVRRWTTDYLRPICRTIHRAEEIAGKLPGMGSVGGIWERLFPNTDPKVASNMCRYIRKYGESVFTPEEEEQRIVREIARCRAELAAQ